MSGAFKALWHPSKGKPEAAITTKQTNKHKNQADKLELQLGKKNNSILRIV